MRHRRLLPAQVLLVDLALSVGQGSVPRLCYQCAGLLKHQRSHAGSAEAAVLQ
jgi:hypothetical protein